MIGRKPCNTNLLCQYFQSNIFGITRVATRVVTRINDYTQSQLANSYEKMH